MEKRKKMTNKIFKYVTGKRCQNKLDHSDTTSIGRLDGLPDSMSGRYSVIALVTTKARIYSATPLLSTA